MFAPKRNKNQSTSEKKLLGPSISAMAWNCGVNLACNLFFQLETCVPELAKSEGVIEMAVSFGMECPILKILILFLAHYHVI